ncbi:signal recognition particle 19 kDa protein-like [Oscarella lobularis]|uniref:signal recognition particle 19 kDa protein-like n=1 Tax=Oscarella lobularis TaxID=121494 RepID=UPI00331319C1
MAAAQDLHLPSDPSNPKRWICIYPAYLNARKTAQEGRRIAKAKAVDHPTCNEIRDVCTSQGLQVEVESSKHYPRDWSKDPTFAGRVRVQIQNERGEPCKDEFPNRKAIYLFVASMIPKLKSRLTRGTGGGGGGGGSGQGAQADAGSSGKKQGKKSKKK